MNIFIIHGDHASKSLERLQTYISAAKKKGWEIVRLRDTGLNIREVVVSQSLFNNEKLVVIDNFNQINSKDILWLKKNKDNKANIVIFHPNILSKININKLPNVKKVEEFNLPKVIWNFLDSFFPGNAKNTMLLLDKVLEKEAVEFVTSLLARQLRDIYIVKLSGNFPGYPSWRIGKLKSSAAKFKGKKLERIIIDLAKYDLRSKTTNSKMSDSLDFLIASKLK
jgi:DNA polymerase III delta subunit